MLHQAQSSVAAQVEAEWRAQTAEEGLRRAQGELIEKEASLSAAELQAAGVYNDHLPPHSLIYNVCAHSLSWLFWMENSSIYLHISLARLQSRGQQLEDLPLMTDHYNLHCGRESWITRP